MHDIEDTVAKLQKLRDIGVQLAIDDFGTGYSSLAYFSRLPVQIIKIDRSFIHGVTADPEVLSTVQAIISLCRALGRTTVAEAVESDEQARVLGELGCDVFQGFLFSKPLPGDQVRGLLAAPAA